MTSKIILAALAATLALCLPAKADTLFENPFVPGQTSNQLCDPCDSGRNFRVWDSFSLANASTLASLQWIGSFGETLPLGVTVTIADQPFGTQYYSNSFAHSAIDIVDVPLQGNGTGNVQMRTVSLGDLALDAGTYWLTVYGNATDSNHTWRGQVEPGGDNSLLQYNLNSAPLTAIPRNEDARFLISGTAASPVPGPLAGAGLPGLVFAVLGLFGWRRRQQNLT